MVATIGGYIYSSHTTQYDNSPYQYQNCTPTTGANGTRASSAGRVNLTGAGFRALIPRYAETNPGTSGWSLEDLDHACAKVSVGFQVRSGTGWTALLAALGVGLYVALQGDSDRFSNYTCSGKFDGDHAIGVHPATRLVNGLRQHWINDPICPAGRWEYDYIIRSYAQKLSWNIRFGVFTTAVKKVVVPTISVILRYGGVKLYTAIVKIIAVPAGQRANVRSRPTTEAALVMTLANGAAWTAYQKTSTGQLLAGSKVWYGNRDGTRWLHISSF